MSDILSKIAICIERGRSDINSPHPPDLKGRPGADELTKQALDEGAPPGIVLSDALVPAMQAVGEKFARNEIFIPDVLMAARAMKAAMSHLRPFFQSGEVARKGIVVIGTVAGDLHDIGKNLVGMILEGGGWEVVDLGVDVSPERFIGAMKEHPGCAVGLSALLTTTMPSMAGIVKEIKSASPDTVVIIGGAPITKDFAVKIGADAYFPDPQGAVSFLNRAAIRRGGERT
jgi:5-methyltetrahydrofolate--homocysteine methyltransferase